MKEYKHINTGRIVKLSSLIKSGDITDDSIIQIFDKAGAFVARGNWYQDNVLDQAERWGRASKAGTGHTVKFQLA